MLSTRHPNHSPAKENVSPDSLTNSPRKQAPTVKQLIQLLKHHNIPVPQELIQKALNTQKSTNEFQLKQIPCDNSQQLKRLKIQLNDSKFELKKLQEDFAEFKVLTRMQKQKLTKKYISQIQQLKKKIQQDNTSWQKRYTQKCQQFAHEKSSFQKKVHSQYKHKASTQSQSLKKQYQHKIESLQTSITQLNSTIKQKQTQHLKEKETLLHECQKKVQLEVSVVKTTSNEKEKQLTKKLENKIEVIELEKKIDSKKSEETIHKLETEINKLKNDIYFLKKEKDELSTELKTKDRKILHLQMAIRAKQQVHLSAQQVFEEEKQKIHAQHEQNIKEIKKTHIQQIKSLMSQHLNELDSYYQRVNNLEQKKKTAEAILKDEMCILQDKFTQRLSKPQDIQEIQRLNTQLALKERQLTRYQDQLRSSQLVRVNNEKNYTRIFSAHSSRRKSSNSHRDTTIFKQSNTTDLKVLLKICNKEF